MGSPEERRCSSVTRESTEEKEGRDACNDKERDPTVESACRKLETVENEPKIKRAVMKGRRKL